MSAFRGNADIRRQLLNASYFVALVGWFRIRLTTDWGSRNERAIAAGFIPAWCEALMRLAFPAGRASSGSQVLTRFNGDA